MIFYLYDTNGVFSGASTYKKGDALPSNAYTNIPPPQHSDNEYCVFDEGEWLIKNKDKQPDILLTNVNVTGEHVTLGNGGIWWLPKNSAFTLTANAELPDAEMMIIVERVINGSTVVDDLRIKAAITGGVITVNGLFAMSGNYIITAQRLNQGLEIIGAPFRLAFDKVEFDAHV